MRWRVLGSSRSVSGEPCGGCSGRLGGERKGEREVLVSVPAGAEDGDRIPIGGDPGAFVLLRVSPQPPDSILVRAVAAAGLLAAVGFLAFLLLG